MAAVVELAARTPLRLNILLSAYACEPGQGSEPGIGWQWAVNLAEAGHRVWVITRANNRTAIERELQQRPVAGLYFAYYDLPAWARWWKRRGRGVHLYYTLWQWGAYQVAKRLRTQHAFDLVHHLTFGVFRQPSFMPLLNLPFVFGPVGGGEAAPPALRRTLRWRDRLYTCLRQAANAWVNIDPMMHMVFRRSQIILCKTQETLQCIPARYHSRCQVLLEIGMPPATERPVVQRSAMTVAPRVLYVGRLVYFKAMHLGLPAFAALHARYPGARLTIVGNGPLAPRLRLLAEQLQIDHAIDWVPWMPREQVLRMYGKHDVFLFPSMHDSSGNVVLEALSRGLPVVCLNLGGPAVIVDDSCGLRVPVVDARSAIDGLATALITVTQDEIFRRRLAQGAWLRASEFFSWSRQTERMNVVYAAAYARGKRGDHA